MIYALIFVIVFMWVAGAFLMRATLKVTDATDVDSWKPVVFWPFYMATVFWDILTDSEYKFKW